MIINAQNSAQIVQRIGKILNKNINIMDMDGIIVASTDASRIGTFHKGAMDLILRSVSEIDIYSGDNISGTREGINVPIRVDGQTIGVVGITGNPDELRDISMVIGEMASIFFLQSVLSRQKELSDRQRRMFWEDILFQSHNQVRESDIRRGWDLDVFVERIRSVAVVYQTCSEEKNQKARSYNRLLSSLHTSLDASVLMYRHYVGNRLVLMFSQDFGGELAQRLNQTLAALRQNTADQYYCGISDGCRSYVDLARAYQQAETALDIALRSNMQGVCHYDDLALEILLNQLSHQSRTDYIRHIFSDISQEELEGYLDFLRIFFSCNGSIQKIADTLFIHKNTVQYKIHKIIDLTGYDPRKCGDATVLDLCVRIAGLA